jgi:hypothetical protein
MLVFTTAAHWDAIDRIWDEILARPLLPEPTAAPAQWASGDLLTPLAWAEPALTEAPVAVVVGKAPAAGRRRAPSPRPARPSTPKGTGKGKATPAASTTRRTKTASPEQKAPASRSRRKPARPA